MATKANKITVYVKAGGILHSFDFITEIPGYEPYVDWSGGHLLIMRPKPEGGAGVMVACFNDYSFFTKHY